MTATALANDALNRKLTSTQFFSSAQRLLLSFSLRTTPTKSKHRNMHFPVLFLLLAAWAVVSLAQERYRVFDYEKFPSCADAYQIPSTAELICVPPAAPVTNSAIYLDCFCRSDFLKSFHSSGAICHQVCGDGDIV
jgi:hypothetical protein